MSYGGVVALPTEVSGVSKNNELVVGGDAKTFCSLLREGEWRSPLFYAWS